MPPLIGICVLSRYKKKVIISPLKSFILTGVMSLNLGKFKTSEFCVLVYTFSPNVAILETMIRFEK